MSKAQILIQGVVHSLNLEELVLLEELCKRTRLELKLNRIIKEAVKGGLK